MNKLLFDFSKEKIFFFNKEQDWMITIDGNRIIINQQMAITYTLKREKRP